MAEYVVKGAEPNETVLHSRTPNGYEEWRWLPVREEVVRCRDCKFFDTRKCKSQWPFRFDGFCAWGERGEDG